MHGEWVPIEIAARKGGLGSRSVSRLVTSGRWPSRRIFEHGRLTTRVWIQEGDSGVGLTEVAPSDRVEGADVASMFRLLRQQKTLNSDTQRLIIRLLCELVVEVEARRPELAALIVEHLLAAVDGHRAIERLIDSLGSTRTAELCRLVVGDALKANGFFRIAESVVDTDRKLATRLLIEATALAAAAGEKDLGRRAAMGLARIDPAAAIEVSTHLPTLDRGDVVVVSAQELRDGRPEDAALALTHAAHLVLAENGFQDDRASAERSRRLLLTIIWNLALLDAEAAVEISNRLDEPSRSQAIASVIEALPDTRTDRAEALCALVASAFDRASALICVADRLLETDPKRAASLLVDATSIAPPGLLRTKAILKLAHVDAPIAGILALELAEPSRSNALARVVEYLADTDPARAEALSRSIGPNAARALALTCVAGPLSAIDPGRAAHLLVEATLLALEDGTEGPLTAAVRMLRRLGPRELPDAIGADAALRYTIAACLCGGHTQSESVLAEEGELSGLDWLVVALAQTASRSSIVDARSATQALLDLIDVLSTDAASAVQPTEGKMGKGGDR